MREAVVKDLCDLCYRESGDKVEADKLLRFTVTGSEELSLDLCNDHAEATNVAEMIEFANPSLAEDKRDSRGYRIRAKAGKEPCKFCGNSYSHGSGMALHIKSAHQEQINAHKVMVTG